MIQQMIGSVIFLIFRGTIGHRILSFPFVYLFTRRESFDNNNIPVHKDFDMTPFYWAIILIGGCIALTLSYVSWKKYRAEEKKKIKKDTHIQ